MFFFPSFSEDSLNRILPSLPPAAAEPPPPPIQSQMFRAMEGVLFHSLGAGEAVSREVGWAAARIDWLKMLPCELFGHAAR